MSTERESALRAELSAYLDGELDGARRAEVERWLAATPAARRELAELRAVAQGLAGIPRESAPPGLTESIRLIARDQLRGPGQRRLRQRYALLRVGGVAAGVLFCIVAVRMALSPAGSAVGGADPRGESRLAGRPAVTEISPEARSTGATPRLGLSEGVARDDAAQGSVNSVEIAKDGAATPNGRVAIAADPAEAVKSPGYAAGSAPPAPTFAKNPAAESDEPKEARGAARVIELAVAPASDEAERQVLTKLIQWQNPQLRGTSAESRQSSRVDDGAGEAIHGAARERAPQRASGGAGGQTGAALDAGAAAASLAGARTPEVTRLETGVVELELSERELEALLVELNAHGAVTVVEGQKQLDHPASSRSLDQRSQSMPAAPVRVAPGAALQLEEAPRDAVDDAAPGKKRTPQRIQVRVTVIARGAATAPATDRATISAGEP